MTVNQEMKSNTSGGMTRALRSDALPPPPVDVICSALNIRSLTIDWLAGDGSDRCYYRIRSMDLPDSCVLMQLSGTDAQALAEGRYDWITLSATLATAGVRVPRVVASLEDYAAIIIEDYGDLMLESVIQEQAMTIVDRPQILEFYRQAFKVIGQMLTIHRDPTSVWCQRAFDHERLQWELDFFLRQTLDRLPGFVSERTRAQFTAESKALSAELGALAKHFVHRDFHSRNIMVKSGQLAIIDFQDARLGSSAYDLVSLVFDPYVNFAPAQRIELLARGIAEIAAHLDSAEIAQIELVWRHVLIQRQLKAIGSYGYLTWEKQRGNYLRYIGPAVDVARYAASSGSADFPLLSREIWDMIQEWMPLQERYSNP